MASRKAYEIRKLAGAGQPSFIAFHSSGPGDFMWHYHDYYELFIPSKGGGLWQIGPQGGDFEAG